MVAEAGSVASINMSINRSLFDPAAAANGGMTGLVPTPGPDQYVLATPPGTVGQRRGRDEGPGSGGSNRAARPAPSRQRIEDPLLITGASITPAQLEDFRQHMVMFVQAEKAKVMGVVEHEMKRTDSLHAMPRRPPNLAEASGAD